MTYREVTRRLVALGCEERARRGRGSHRKWFNPKSQRGTVVPDWGSRDLKTGTIRNAVRQLGLGWHDFANA
ncbi:MAG: type II toxin-antitoxin system HicA family toxin [Gammaproteobacteria bacterium]|nr:type II toxin-antitoxin system HicA family toxin [Gammaproteobacteria bacterium]